MQTAHQRIELPEGIRTQLEAFRRRVWLIKLAEGVLAALFGLLVSYLLVFLLDRFWDTPAWLRGLTLVAGTAGLGIGLPIKWHRWVWRTRRLEQVARLLRHRWPRLSDQLLGIVELVQADVEQKRSAVLCRAAMRQVDEQAHRYDLRVAVPHPSHRRWGWTAGGALLVTLAVLLLVPSAGSNALLRWLMPWKATPRYTFAQLEDLPDRLVVPYAESFPLRPTLSKASAWAPREASVQYGQQRPLRAALRDNAYHFRIPAQKEQDTLRLSVGDARQDVLVQPTLRPELADIQVRALLPDYLQHSTAQVKDVRGGSVSLLKGSRAVVELAATRELADARLDGLPQRIEGRRLISESVLIEQPQSYQLTWRDHLGLSAKKPFLLSVLAVEDEAPTIACSQLQHQQVVLDQDVLSFQVAAQDDYGVKLIGMRWKGIADPLRNPNPAEGEQIIALGEPEQGQLQLESAFSAQRLGIAPQSLELRLFTVDYLPERERVYSAPYILHVLSPEEHAIWLTQQLRKWFGSAQAVYEREQQLHQTNRELRGLPPAEIDRPENRRRIELQASAEQANARRLDQVIVSGEQLFKEAVRNDQFNVATLETWAEMLKALDDISQQRMPSVADLLKQASLAPASPSAAPSPGEQKPQDPSHRVGVSRDSRKAPGDAPAPDERPPSEVPSIVDVESGFNELEQGEAGDQSQPAGKPRFSLPSTTVLGGGLPQEGGDNASAPAQEKMDEAVEEQEDLLAEFARVAEELQKILDNLEGSTFVKRLKAASRRQLKIAADLNEELLAQFGLAESQIEDQKQQVAEKIAERELAHSNFVYNIQEDLEAYFNRVLEGKYQTVLNEMKTTEVVRNIHQVGTTAQYNWSGQAIAQAEFWADALDRWAEQLVGPG